MLEVAGVLLDGVDGTGVLLAVLLPEIVDEASSESWLDRDAMLTLSSSASVGTWRPKNNQKLLYKSLRVCLDYSNHNVHLCMRTSIVPIIVYIFVCVFQIAIHIIV